MKNWIILIIGIILIIFSHIYWYLIPYVYITTAIGGFTTGWALFDILKPNTNEKRN